MAGGGWAASKDKYVSLKSRYRTIAPLAKVARSGVVPTPQTPPGGARNMAILNPMIVLPTELTPTARVVARSITDLGFTLRIEEHDEGDR